MILKFQDLIVWRKAIDLYKQLTTIINYLPKEEVECLGYQLKKSALAISTNIASGTGRGSNQNFRYFLLIALGNLKEVESGIILVSELKYLDLETSNTINLKIKEIERMLNSLIEKID
jgi:four helix bundle protein